MSKKTQPIQSFLNSIKGSTQPIYFLYSAAKKQYRAVSGNEFLRDVCKWATIIQRLEDSVLPIFGRTSPEMLSAYFGTILANKIPVFISYPNSKIRPEDYKVKLQNYRQAFGNRQFIGSEDDSGSVASLVTFDKETPILALDSFPERRQNYLFYQSSSGTTGLQKIVGITEDQLLHQIKVYSKAIKLNQRDSIASWLPLYHDMGLITSFFMPFLTSTPVVYLDPFEWVKNPNSLLEVIEQKRSTLTWLPNFAFSLMAKSPGEFDLSSMRSFISCSEPAKQRSFLDFSRSHSVCESKFSVCYALAENVFAVSQTEIGRAVNCLSVDASAYQTGKIIPRPHSKQVVLSCGSLIESDSVLIDCGEGQDVGPIYIKGPCTVSNYIGKSTPLADGWFPTGDLGFIRDGELYISGREKDLIICNGKNIHPQDVEELVNTYPGIHAGRCVAIGLPDELKTERLLVLYEAAQNSTRRDRSKLASALKQRIDGVFEISSEVLAVPKMWLRKTSSGKIANASNLEKYLAHKNRTIHVVGDSHVRLLWTEDRSYRSAARNVKAHWWGVVWSGNWREFSAKLLDLISGLSANDVFIVEAGEPEIRIVFPSSKEPLARIECAVRDYRDYFHWLREHFSGEIAFMTGPPSNSTIIGPEITDLSTGETAGTPELRYILQREFLSRMSAMCAEEEVEFLDMVTPWLGINGFIDPALLRDSCHLHQECQEVYFELLDRFFGFVSLVPEMNNTEVIEWDFTYNKFEMLFERFLRDKIGSDRIIDFGHLVKSGAIDSRMFVSIIAWMEKTLEVKVNLLEVNEEAFESTASIYQSFIDKP